MSEYYGFEKLSIRKLKEDLTPDTSLPIIEISGDPKKGGTSSFELTGLSKSPVKVFASNIAYYLSRKGTGEVAANFGLLDLNTTDEATILGIAEAAAGIQGIGEDTEPPYVAAIAESEDLYGEPVAFALVAGTFTRDGYKFDTKNDDDFTPEPGEYVYTSISRSITFGAEAKTYKVLRASGTTAVDLLKTTVLGGPVAG